MMGTGGKGVGSARGEGHCRNGRAEVRTLSAMGSTPKRYFQERVDQEILNREEHMI